MAWCSCPPQLWTTTFYACVVRGVFGAKREKSLAPPQEMRQASKVSTSSVLMYHTMLSSAIVVIEHHEMLQKCICETTTAVVQNHQVFQTTRTLVSSLSPLSKTSLDLVEYIYPSYELYKGVNSLMMRWFLFVSPQSTSSSTSDDSLTTIVHSRSAKTSLSLPYLGQLAQHRSS